MRLYSFVLVTLLVLAFPFAAGAQSTSAHYVVTSAPPPNTTGCSGPVAAGAADDKSSHGFNLADLDRSVKPCDDFYQFAEGSWKKNNPIPADQSDWGSFEILQQRNEGVLHEILEEAVKDKTDSAGSNWQKIGDFYGSCMDEAQIESAGVKPLGPELERIAAIHDSASLQAEIAHLQRAGANAVFGFGSEPDFKNSTQRIAGVGQGGLGLPDRDYYIRDDEKSKQLRDAYVKHVTNMFKLLGDTAAAAAGEAKAVMAIENSLAKASLPNVDLRDPDKNYHLMPLSQTASLTPHIVWAEFFKEVKAPAVSSMDIGQPEFFKQVDADIASIPLADWKAYLRWQYVHAVAPALPPKFVEENFNFYSRTLTGTAEMLPRWQRCVRATDAHLGEALGQYYVKREFPPEAKQKALVMVKNIIAALRADLATLDWMSPETRRKAVEKLDAIDVKIGYPDKWRDYSPFHVDRGSYAGNALSGNTYNFDYDAARIGKPVDRGEWDASPPTVDAYYRPTMNDITFPAGILQPPFFDPNRDDALNYGGIGAVIGHELTHGFDDQGAKFDAQGNLKNWWTPEDLKNFEERGNCIAKQFDGYTVEPGLNENGKLVEGESIADFGGLTIAYAALQKALADKPAAPSIDGFTEDQRFFLGWAQIWADNFRPEFARLLVNTNPHPLSHFRVNGPLSNMPAFAKAYECSTNSPMVRPAAERCRIW